MPGLDFGKKAAPTRAQASAQIGEQNPSHRSYWPCMGLPSNGVCLWWLPTPSAATGAYLHTADGNTMAESRCTPEQFRL
jgi:hypothetical protein